jgi:hypothetical protein
VTRLAVPLGRRVRRRRYDTDQVVSRATTHLTCARDAAHVLGHALDAAHQHTNQLAAARAEITALSAARDA